MNPTGPQPPANFDRLVRVYRALEFLSFGQDLERARFAFLDRLRDCRSILVLGEGDGRCLARLVAAAPAAQIHCVDASAAMLTRAEGRIADSAGRARVTFTRADVFALELGAGRYDAVITLFFLDCFTAGQTADIVARVGASLRAGALWLWADFAVPPRGWARWRARLWLPVLYAFFRWETRIAARALPPAEEILRAAGWRREAARDFQGGLVRAALFSQPGSRT